MADPRKTLDQLMQLRRFREQQAGARLASLEQRRRRVLDQLRDIARQLEHQGKREIRERDTLFESIRGRPLSPEDFQAYRAQVESLDHQRNQFDRQRSALRLELIRIERERGQKRQDYQDKIRRRERGDSLAGVFREKAAREAAMQEDAQMEEAAQPMAYAESAKRP